jgi:flagellar basal body-associated protein FliL
MSDKADNKAQEKKDKGGAEAGGAAAEKAGAKPPGVVKLLLFVGMPLMVVQAGIAYYLISHFMPAPGGHAASAEESATASEEHAEGDDSTAVESEEHGEAGSEGSHGKAPAKTDALGDSPEEKAEQFTHYVKDIIINPAATAGTRFLNVSFAFDYGREKLKAELEESDFRVRDAIINVLVTKRIDEIDGAEDKELLREQILTVVNNLLKTGRIRKVYFTNFVIQ